MWVIAPKGLIWSWISRRQCVAVRRRFEFVIWKRVGWGASGESANKTSCQEAPAYPWEQRSSMSMASSAQPQILVQSGVGSDEIMNDVTKLETTLIEIGANYELTRFSDAKGKFTDFGSDAYNSRATARSFEQVQSLLKEVFAEDCHFHFRHCCYGSY
jgi:dienelactone hydrolase